LQKCNYDVSYEGWLKTLVLILSYGRRRSRLLKKPSHDTWVFPYCIKNWND